jgi:hypothetical protein
MKVPPEILAKILAKAGERIGGDNELERLGRAEFFQSLGRWDQDVDEIGRILRAHLYVERYMTEYLEATNPRLGSLDEARLGFAQKIALLDKKDSNVQECVSGLRRLNTIRNRLAHRSHEAVTDEDGAFFLKCAGLDVLLSMRGAKAEDALDALEEFAKHMAIVFTFEQSPVARAIHDAILEALPQPKQ